MFDLAVSRKGCVVLHLSTNARQYKGWTRYTAEQVNLAMSTQSEIDVLLQSDWIRPPVQLNQRYIESKNKVPLSIHVFHDHLLPFSGVVMLSATLSCRSELHVEIGPWLSLIGLFSRSADIEHTDLKLNIEWSDCSRHWPLESQCHLWSQAYSWSCRSDRRYGSSFVAMATDTCTWVELGDGQGTDRGGKLGDGQGTNRSWGVSAVLRFV